MEAGTVDAGAAETEGENSANVRRMKKKNNERIKNMYSEIPKICLPASRPKISAEPGSLRNLISDKFSPCLIYD
jgi:hypothetical protein